MLYFAFGSNLNQKQMKKRCKDSKYIGCYSLKNYKLVFRNFYLGGGVADVQKQKKSTVLGAIYQISKSDEKKLDIYEDFPNTYIKKYFKLLGKKPAKWGGKHSPNLCWIMRIVRWTIGVFSMVVLGYWYSEWTYSAKKPEC